MLRGVVLASIAAYILYAVYMYAERGHTKQQMEATALLIASPIPPIP